MLKDSENKIREKLSFDPSSVTVFNILDSTNDYLKSRAGELRGDFHVVCARAQSSGRGRRGKSFYSPDGGCYFSVLIDPEADNSSVSSFTLCAAVCVARSISELTGIKCGIKWVNDVLIDTKKVCGILCESVIGTDSRTRIICGIGVNLREPAGGFPAEIADKACALEQFTEPPLPEDLITDVIERIHGYAPRYDIRDYIDDYRALSCVIGNDVQYVCNDETIPARVLGIGDDGSLLIRDRLGNDRSVITGSIIIT